MEAYQAILSLTVSLSLLKFMSIGSVMVSNYLILCHPLLFLPSMFPSTRVFSSELALSIRCPAYTVSASATVLSMNTQGWFPLELTSAFSLKSKGISRMFSSTTIWKHQFFSAQPLTLVHGYWKNHVRWKSLSHVPLCNPMASTVHGILQAGILEWVAILFSRGSSQPRDQTQVSCIADRFFTSWATREALEKP